MLGYNPSLTGNMTMEIEQPFEDVSPIVKNGDFLF